MRLSYGDRITIGMLLWVALCMIFGAGLWVALKAIGH